MSIRKDYTIDVLRLLENLKQQVEAPKTVMGLTFGYNRDNLVMQIEKIRASMPREVKDAATVARESERIIESAREEADTLADQMRREADRTLTEARAESDRILAQAKIEQERMIQESEVLKLAKAQAEEIRNSAEIDAQQMRRGADRYAMDVLNNVESVVGKVLTVVERGKAELESNDSVAVPANNVRERARV